MRHFVIILSAISAIFILPTYGANIFAILPSPSPSHLIIEMAVVNAMAENNHNVTVMTVLPLRGITIHPRVKHIELKSGYVDLQAIIRGGGSGLKMMRNFLNMFAATAQSYSEMLDEPELKDFLHNPDNKFDLVLYGYMMSDVLFGLAAHFDCPLAVVWVNQAVPNILRLIGNPFETSYVGLPYTNEANSDGKYGFKFRLYNLMVTGIEQTLMLIGDINMKRVYDAHFPAGKYPSYRDIKKTVSMVLYAHHFSEKPVRPQVPGLIEIGGIQLNEKPKPLPQDIDEFLAGATEHGAVFFSLGTNVRNDHLQPEVLTKIFNVLSKLPQRVLWKCDNVADVPGNSSNIMYKKWLPQADILGHPNLRLFFGHGGKGGITEAQFNGVSIVGLPIFGDQPMNMEEVVRRGYGLSIDHDQPVTEETIANAVKDVLYNPKYRNAVQTFSKLYRDRPLSAKQNAVYWLEYLMRHKGAPHMQSPLKMMNVVQKHNLDILLFAIIVLYLVIKLVKFVCRIILRKCGKSLSKRSKTD